MGHYDSGYEFDHEKSLRNKYKAWYELWQELQHCSVGGPAGHRPWVSNDEKIDQTLEAQIAHHIDQADLKLRVLLNKQYRGMKSGYDHSLGKRKKPPCL